ncbi:winged helix DNA-binding domain-containing protein [Asanoa siamensis]|uniref:Winged helix DNA-binding domain-containing protein n=1 Tax=Asanoa siamensis TaxID=926357 RepID=A0ABQ4D1S6_9ACTN|nr:winged helix DNA-binding domain-containing protein [Asanoa siamensis]GIF77213.1 hypothetical protein Asi02nite_67310 [Asanoa siamensis]
MHAVTWDQVLRWRMRRHHLAGDKATDPVAVARRVVGVHAQVAASAVTATGLRTRSATTLDSLLYEQRTLVRTWAARGTLHLIPADDYPVWVAAMSTRTRETTNSWLRYNNVTAEQLQDILAALPDVLGAEPLTREELADAIITATGHQDLRDRLTQGFGTLLKPAAFRGLLCSGPPRGRNVTFVAPRAWLGGTEQADTDAAIDHLVSDYLGAYGPAAPEEFARWFDLTPARAKKAFKRLDLAEVDLDGETTFLPPEHLADLAGLATRSTSAVALLPAFDPYITGSTRQLEKIGAAGHRSAVSRPQGWISPTLVVDGWVRGVWEPGDDGKPKITTFGTLPATVRKAVTKLSTGG